MVEVAILVSAGASSKYPPVTKWSVARVVRSRFSLNLHLSQRSKKSILHCSPLLVIDYSKRATVDTDSEPEVSAPPVPTPRAPAPGAPESDAAPAKLATGCHRLVRW